jgi:hypothetical protein
VRLADDDGMVLLKMLAGERIRTSSRVECRYVGKRLELRGVVKSEVAKKIGRYWKRRL